MGGVPHVQDYPAAVSKGFGVAGGCTPYERIRDQKTQRTLIEQFEPT